jgi:hypothetical protein
MIARHFVFNLHPSVFLEPWGGHLRAAARSFHIFIPSLMYPVGRASARFLAEQARPTLVFIPLPFGNLLEQNHHVNLIAFSFPGEDCSDSCEPQYKPFLFC